MEVMWSQLNPAQGTFESATFTVARSRSGNEEVYYPSKSLPVFLGSPVGSLRAHNERDLTRHAELSFGSG